jgi:hydrogenase maturation protease
MTMTETELLAPQRLVDSPAAPAPILVLGLGNDILTDDAIGLRVVRALREHLDPDGPVQALEVEEMGLSLLDYIVGCRDLVLVDAIQTGEAPPGTLHELDGNVIQTRRGGSPHLLGRLLGLAVPERVRIFAIEVADPYTLGTELTPALAEALPGVLARVQAAVTHLAAGRA